MAYCEVAVSRDSRGTLTGSHDLSPVRAFCTTWMYQATLTVGGVSCSSQAGVRETPSRLTLCDWVFLRNAAKGERVSACERIEGPPSSFDDVKEVPGSCESRNITRSHSAPQTGWSVGGVPCVDVVACHTIGCAHKVTPWARVNRGRARPAHLARVSLCRRLSSTTMGKSLRSRRIALFSSNINQ